MADNRPSRPIQILLVEDNYGDARLAIEAFREANSANQIVTVPDGVAALEYLRRHGQYTEAARPDVILLDLNLPRKDGREVLAEIKADPHLRRIPVIVLTTSKATDDIVKTYDLHANCYVTKPLSLDQFFGVIKSIESFWLMVATLPPGAD